MDYVRHDRGWFGCAQGGLMGVALAWCAVSGLWKQPNPVRAADDSAFYETASDGRSNAYSEDATDTGSAGGEAVDESLLDPDIEQLAQEDVGAQVIWKR